MRDISGEFKARLARKDLSLCRVVQLTLKNGTTYYLTDASSNVRFGNRIYRSKPGIEVSNIRGSLNGGYENATITIGYGEDETIALSERLVRYGATDDATYKVTVVDYMSPGSGGMIIFEGSVLSVGSTDKSSCTLDVGGYTATTFVVGENYSQRCRNVLGDRRCKVDLEALSVIFTVLAVEPDGSTFTINAQTDVEVITRPEVSASGTTHFAAPGPTDFVVPDYDILTLDTWSGSGAGGSSALGALANIGQFDPGDIAEGYPGGRGGDSTVKTASGTVIAGAGGGQGGYAGGFVFPNGPVLPSKGVGYVVPAGINFNGVPGGIGADRSLLGAIGYGSFKGGDADRGTRNTTIINRTDPGAPQPGDVLKVACGAAGVAAALGEFPMVRGKDGTAGYVDISWSFNQTMEVARFDQGTILWMQGLNAGTISQIDVNDDQIISLAQFPNFAVQPGDVGKFRPGCTNYADYCLNRFNNLQNMQAEPAVPAGLADAPTSTTTVVPDPAKPASPPANSEAGAVPYSSGTTAHG